MSERDPYDREYPTTCVLCHGPKMNDLEGYACSKCVDRYAEWKPIADRWDAEHPYPPTPQEEELASLRTRLSAAEGEASAAKLMLDLAAAAGVRHAARADAAEARLRELHEEAAGLRRSLLAAEARARELEDELDAKHAKLVEVADKFRAGVDIVAALTAEAASLRRSLEEARRLLLEYDAGREPWSLIEWEEKVRVYQLATSSPEGKP